MPKQRIENVKIMGCNIKIQYFESIHRSDGEMGKCDSKMSVIYLNSEMPDDVIRQTLLHEIMHKLSDDLCLDLKEEQIGALSTSLFGVLTDHPGIV
jgi:hypothetical protein